MNGKAMSETGGTMESQTKVNEHGAVEVDGKIVGWVRAAEDSELPLPAGTWWVIPRVGTQFVGVTYPTRQAGVDALASLGREVDECEGHPAGPFDPMGQTAYCDGSCRS